MMPSLTYRKNLERPEGALNTSEMAREAGVNYKKANDWAARGHFRTIGDHVPGSGNFRWHPASEVETLRLGAELIGIGFEPRVAFPLARKMDIEMGPAVLNGWVLIRPARRP